MVCLKVRREETDNSVKRRALDARFLPWLPDRAEAEELTQETFLAVLRASARYEPSALFRTYLYAIGFRRTRLIVTSIPPRVPTLHRWIPRASQVPVRTCCCEGWVMDTLQVFSRTGLSTMQKIQKGNINDRGRIRVGLVVGFGVSCRCVSVIRS